MKVLSFLKKIRRDERGISAVEYAILIGVVGVALVGALSPVGGQIGGYVTSQIAALTTGASAGGTGTGTGTGTGN